LVASFRAVFSALQHRSETISHWRYRNWRQNAPKAPYSPSPSCSTGLGQALQPRTGEDGDVRVTIRNITEQVMIDMPHNGQVRWPQSGAPGSNACAGVDLDLDQALARHVAPGSGSAVATTSGVFFSYNTVSLYPSNKPLSPPTERSACESGA
jgi:hypothetical protein